MLNAVVAPPLPPITVIILPCHFVSATRTVLIKLMHYLLAYLLLHGAYSTPLLLAQTDPWSFYIRTRPSYGSHYFLSDLAPTATTIKQVQLQQRYINDSRVTVSPTAQYWPYYYRYWLLSESRRQGHRCYVKPDIRLWSMSGLLLAALSHLIQRLSPVTITDGSNRRRAFGRVFVLPSSVCEVRLRCPAALSNWPPPTCALDYCWIIMKSPVPATRVPRLPMVPDVPSPAIDKV